MNKLNDACRIPSKPAIGLRRYSAALAALALVMWAPGAAPAQSPTAAQMEKNAYVAMLAADSQRDRGDTVSAAAGYEKAARMFQELQSAHPDYNESNIRFRLDYCLRQKESLPPSSPASPAAPPVPPNEAKSAASPDDGADALRSLREEVHRLQSEQEKSLARDKEYADLRDRMTRLQSAARELRDRAARTETELAEARLSAQKDRDARDQMAGELQAMKRASARLLSESAAMETALAESKAALESERTAAAESKAQHAQSAEATQRAQSELQKAAAEYEKSQESIQRLQQELAEARNHAMELEKSAQKADSTEGQDKEINRLKKELEAAQADAGQKGNLLAEAQAAIEAGKAAAEKTAGEQRAREDAAQAMLKKSESELENIRSELAGVRQELEKATQQIESLATEKTQQEATIQGLRDELEQAGLRAGELDKELQAWQERARTALAEGQTLRDARAAAEQAAAQAREEAAKSASRIAELESRMAGALPAAGPGGTPAAPPEAPATAAAEPAAPAAPETPSPEVNAEIESQCAAAREMMRTSDFAGAHTLLGELMKQYPDHVAVLSDAARCAYRMGLIEEAISIYKRLLAIQPDHARANFNLAVLYAKCQPPRLDLSRAHYDRARALGEPRDETLEQQLDR